MRPDPRDLADAIWLATVVGGGVPPSPPTAGAPEQRDAEPGAVAPPVRLPDGERRPVVRGAADARTEHWNLSRARRSRPAGSVTTGLAPRSLEGRIAHARPLPDSEDIGRALRPLRRTVVTGSGLTVDEPATAHHLADFGTMTPLFRPLQERWLELTIVVDTGSTMQLWQDTARALRDLTERHGAFRNVRTLHLDSDRARVELIDDGGNHHHFRELRDHGGRRLIIVLTDGVGPLWRTATARAMLASWAELNPTAVFQVLPDSMWHRTALPPAKVVLRSTAPGRTAVASPVGGRLPRDGGPWIPVVALRPASVAAWADILAGRELFGRPADAVPVGWLPAAVSVEPVAAPTPRERTVRFQSTASPTAFALAGRLAAAPLTLPLMRAIQNVLHPESDLGHLAEVLLSGLLVRGPSTSPDDVQFEFLPGVREELLRLRSRDDAFSVLKTLRDIESFVPNPYGTLDVWVLAAEPHRHLMTHQNSRIFAEVAVTVLGGLGGQYVAMADRLQAGLAQVVPASPGRRSVAALDPDEIRALCTTLRYDRRLHTDDALVDRILRDVEKIRQHAGSRPRPQRPPAELAEVLPLMGWLIYEASWEAVQQIPAGFDRASAGADERQRSEAAFHHVRRLAEAARRLPWPEFAPRALGALRAQALAEAKRDTEAGYDAAWKIHEEARGKYRAFRDDHGSAPESERFVRDLDEVMLQLALAQTGTACRAAEHVISRWAEEFAAAASERHWVERMFRDLTFGLALGDEAIDIAYRVKERNGLADSVSEQRLALRTALQNPGIMTSRAALLLLALGPEMERLGRRADRFRTWAEWEAHVLGRFEKAYRAIEEPVTHEDGRPVAVRADILRQLVHLRLWLALVKPGHRLSSGLPVDPFPEFATPGDAGLEALSEFLAHAPNSPTRERGIGAATMPAVIGSIVAGRRQGPDDHGYQAWRLAWFELDQYAEEPGRRERVVAALNTTTRPDPAATGAHRRSPDTLFAVRDDGLRIAYEMTGAPDGVPVLLMHGTPGGRGGPKPRASVLYRLGIRLVSYDRPGYGDSDRRQGRAVADAAADVAAIADALGLEHFAVLGRSTGAPHALACAASPLLRDRIVRAAVMLTAPPPDEGLGWAGKIGEADALATMSEAGFVAQVLERLPGLEAEAAKGPDFDRAVRALMPDDPRGASNPQVRAAVVEALRTGPYGWIDDLIALRNPWKFDPSSVTVPVLVWRIGSDADDAFVRSLPNAIVHTEKGGAHFGAVDAMPEVLRWLAGPPGLVLAAN